MEWLFSPFYACVWIITAEVRMKSLMKSDGWLVANAQEDILQQ